MSRRSHTLLKPLITLAMAGLIVGCGGSHEPASLDTGAGNTALLDSAYAVAREQPNLTSLVVARNGVIERQEYFNGGGADIPQDVRSITKSVVSLLVGIALERGHLRSLDQTLGELLGPLAPPAPEMKAITLRQLLTMTSGLGGDELAHPELYNQWAAAANQLTYIWEQPLVAPPGSQFNYYSANYYVVSRILTRGTGQTTSDFAQGTLFTPLGIGSRLWETDDLGFFNGGAGLSLTPMDMLTLGNLVLTDGRVNGGQVVSSAWIRASTVAQMPTQAMPSVSGYGYGWWTGQAGESGFVMATGWGGQFIVVVPQKQLVVAATTHWQGVGTTAATAQWQAVMNLIVQRIVPAF